MSKAIRIYPSSITERGDKAIIEYPLEADGKFGVLWFKTSSKWKDYICKDLADGVVVTLLLYAVRGGYDIVSDMPVSRSLLNRLNNHVIPQLVLCTKDACSTRIICPIGTEAFTPDRTATAMSMGIDSFTTFFEYTKDCPPEADRIDLLTFMQSGQTSFAEDEDGLFADQLADARHFADEYGYELLDISSNIYSLYNSLFWNEEMIHVSTCRNCGMILLFQKLIKTYYYSSSYNLDEFHCSLTEDVTHYEKWLLPNISTDAMTIYSSNKGMTRLEKTKYICRNPETYNYLQVCCRSRHACGKCNKCIRTMFTLEYLGVLDNYRSVFDVDEFRKKKKHNLVELLGACDNSIDKEAADLYKDDISPLMRFYGNILMTVHKDGGKVHSLAKKIFTKHPKVKKFTDYLKKTLY